MKARSQNDKGRYRSGKRSGNLYCTLINLGRGSSSMASRKAQARPSGEEDQSDSAPGDSSSSQHHGEDRFSPPQQENEHQEIPPSDVSQKQYSKRQARSSPHNRPRISPGHQNPLIYGYPQRYAPQQYGPPQLISARSAANAVTPDSRNFLPPDMLSPPTLGTRKRTVLTPGSAMSTTSLSPSKTGRNQGMCYIHAIYIHIELFFFWSVSFPLQCFHDVDFGYFYSITR
jgi:hypothetical protein